MKVNDACLSALTSTLCNNVTIVGASLETAQSKIEGILSSLSDSDCPVITAEYNVRITYSSTLLQHSY